MNGLKYKLSYPFYVMFHPIKGFEGVKWDRKGSYGVSGIILLLFFLVNVIERQMTGFIFNHNELNKINVLSILIVTITVLLLWILSNWSLCTLMEGEGKLGEVWIASIYALLPYILINLLIVFLSNFLSLEAGVFLDFIRYTAYGWSIILVSAAMGIIHQYTFKQTIVNLVLTVVGMGLICFLLVVIYSLFQQLIIFVYTLYNEIMFRI